MKTFQYLRKNCEDVAGVAIPVVVVAVASEFAVATAVAAE